MAEHGSELSPYVINLPSLVPSWRTTSLAWDKVNEKQVDFFPFTMGNHSHNEYCLWHYKHISLKHICVTVMTSNCYIKGSQLNAMLSFTNNDFCLEAFRSETFPQKKTLISLLVYIRHRSLGANNVLRDSWQYHSRNKCCGIMENVRVAGRLFGWVAPECDPVLSLFTISLSANWSPQCNSLCDKVTVGYSANKCPNFRVTLKFVTVFTKACHNIAPWHRILQST